MSNGRIGGVGPVDTLIGGVEDQQRQLLEQLQQASQGGLTDVGALGIKRSMFGGSQRLLLANALAGHENDSIKRIIDSM
jgi:hypothetical protein